MLRWCEIAAISSELRLNHLSSQLKAAGVENKLDFIKTDIEEFSVILKNAMEDYDQIRIGTPFGDRVPQVVDQLPVVTMIQKSADSLIKIEGKWWARSMLTEGLIREMALIKKLDISETAFIVGAGSTCRAVVAALLKMGIKKFNITELYEEKGRDTVRDLKATYFGVEFRFTPYTSITALPGIHSIVVNTTPFVPNNEVLSELYYCNFLKPNGVVIDLTLAPVDTPLLKAVKQVEGRTVAGYEVAALVDLHWVKVAMGIDLPAKPFISSLKAVCENTPVDLSEFDIPEL